MSLLQDQDLDAAVSAYSHPASLLDLIAVANTPLQQSVDEPPAAEPFLSDYVGPSQHQYEITGLTLPADSSQTLALVDDNLSPLLAPAFTADDLLVFKDSTQQDDWIWSSDHQNSEQPESLQAVALGSVVTQTDSQLVTRPEQLIQISEDQPFAVLLADLFSGDTSLQALTLTGPDWVNAGLVEADASIADRLIVQSHLRDAGGQRLRSADLARLSAGTELVLNIDVSDTRLAGQGLIGLQGSLSWNPKAATVLAIDLQETLPLFRSSGGSSDWADGQTQLVAAALPKAGAGQALGDTSQERFAQISLRLNDPTLPLKLAFTPELYPSVGAAVRADQLLNLGIDPLHLPVLQGRPAQDFNGSINAQLRADFHDGARWLQPIKLQVASRNDAPTALTAVVHMPAIDEDQPDPAGHRVAALFEPVFVDVDSGDSLAGIAITHLPDTAASGVWQFKRGQSEWQPLNASLAISERQAFVLTRDELLRFLPAADWSSDQPLPALQVRLFDQSQPLVSGARPDLSTHAGDFAFSRDSLQLTTRVRPVNDAPEPGPASLPLLRARQGQLFSADLPAGSFSDRDLGRNPAEKLTYSLRSPAANVPPPAWLQIDPTTGRLSGIAALNGAPSLSLQIVATDQAGASVARTVEIEVTPVDPANNPPQALPAQHLQLLENEHRTINLSTIFQDQDPGDQLSFSAVIPPAHAGWIQFDSVNQQLLLRPGTTDVTAPAADVKVLLKATDRDGAEATHQLSLTVINTNQAPRSIRLDQRSTLQTVQAQSLALDLNTWFTDPDLAYGDRIRFLIQPSVQPPIGQNPISWLTLDAAGILRGTATNANVGSYDLLLTAIDTAGLTAQHELRLIVDNTNDAPLLSDRAVANLAINEASPWRLDLNDWFTDPDSVHGQSLSFEVSARSGMPRWLQWDPSTAVLSGTPSAQDLGELLLTLRATDGISMLSHQLRLQILNVNDKPVVSRPLTNLTLPEDERKTIDLVGVITDPDPGDLLRYSLRVQDRAGAVVAPTQLSWLQIKTSADNQFSRDDRLVINPIVRSVQDGRQLTAEQLSQLTTGSEFDVEIQIEDNRRGVQQRGLIGADLSLAWNPTVLASTHSTVAELLPGLTADLPVFPRVDITKLSQGRLGLSAASAPAFGLGAVIGDQPAERFATIRMKVLDSSFPVVLDLDINTETEGGLGLGWLDESAGTDRITTASFSSSNRLQLEIAPTNDHVGEYQVDLIATDPGGLSVANRFNLLVPNRNDAPTATRLDIGNLLDNTASRFDLSSYFTDPDLIHGDRLAYAIKSEGQSSWFKLVVDPAGQTATAKAWLDVSIPGLLQDDQQAILITATDQSGATVSQNLDVRALARPEPLPLQPLEAGHLPSAERGQVIRLVDSLKLNTQFKTDSSDHSILTLNMPAQLQLAVANLSGESTAEQQRQWQNAFLQNLSSQPDQLLTRWRLNLSDLSRSSNLSIPEILSLLELRPGSAELDYGSVGPRGTLAMPLSIAVDTTVQGDQQQLYGLKRSTWGPDWIELRSAPTKTPLIEQRSDLQEYDKLTPFERAQISDKLAEFLQNATTQATNLFRPVAKAAQTLLTEQDSNASFLAHQDVVLALDWLERPREYEVTFAVNRIADRYYETAGQTNSEGLSPALQQPVTLYQDAQSDSLLNYQTSIGAISFETDVAPTQAFKVATISLPQEVSVNSLLKSITRDGVTLVAPYSTQQINLAALKLEARAAGLDADQYRALLDARLNSFKLRDYRDNRTISSIVVDAKTDAAAIQSLISSLPWNRIDGSAILIDFDGDGINDVARMLLLDNGFWDSNSDLGTIEDPLYLSQLTVSNRLGDASALSARRSRLSNLLNSADRGSGVTSSAASAPDPASVDLPLSFDQTQPTAEFFAAQPSFPSARSKPVPSGDDQGPWLDRPTARLPLPAVSAETSSAPLSGLASRLQPPLNPLDTLAQIWQDIDNLSADHIVQIIALAAAVTPVVGNLGIGLVKRIEPYQLRLQQSSVLDADFPPQLLLVLQSDPAQPAVRYLLNRDGEQVRLIHLPPSFVPGKTTPLLLVSSGQCWLWSLVMHTARPGLLVQSCHSALRALEVNGLFRAGIDFDLWLQQLISVHCPQQQMPASYPALQSPQQFIVQLLTCLAELGFPYQSIAR